jgi:pseudaminic acid biosynthesis-associated methylase
MTNLNEQQNFWANDYASEYIQKNNKFDEKLGVEGWQKMLTKAEGITSILECGCNIGRNIRFLNKLLPDAEKSIIEISKPAYDFVISNFTIQKHFNGPIVNSVFESGSFDLAFVCGVLIHIHPDDLLANMAKLFQYSKRYILIGEYFSRIPVMIEYQGQDNKLFKQDFGKLFLKNFKVNLVDYGFLWGEVYDNGGFDDITWWLFEKQ